MVLPGMNEILGASNANRFGYARMKKKWGQTVGLFARLQAFPPVSAPAHFEIECREKNRRRDPDNIAGGAQKIILDGLQEAGLLENDGWEHVLSLLVTWKVDAAKPGVLLTVREG
jgi:Holliday junction resolvase RusA-like endonuclease